MKPRQAKRVKRAITDCLVRDQLPCFFVSDNSICGWQLDQARLGSWWWEEPKVCDEQQEFRLFSDGTEESDR